MNTTDETQINGKNMVLGAGRLDESSKLTFWYESDDREDVIDFAKKARKLCEEMGYTYHNHAIRRKWGIVGRWCLKLIYRK